MKYPLLRFNEDCIVRIDGRGRHHRLIAKEIRYWRNPPQTILIDIDGNSFHVLPSEPSTIVWWNFLLLGFRKVYWMRCSMEPISTIGVDELKERVGALVVRKKWHRQTRESAETFLERLSNAHTYREVFKAVNFYGRSVG